MTILDLINKSAVTLNIPEVLNDEKFANITSSTEQQVLNENFALKRLYEFAKIVLNEIGSHISQDISNATSILENIDLPAEIGEDILVCGLNAYYALAVGLFSEFNIYNTNYRQKLNKIKNLKVFAMPCRSWQ